METYNSFVFLVSILTNMASFKAVVLNLGGFYPPRGRLTKLEMFFIATAGGGGATGI